ncbi:MAG: carbamoyltransferase HypF [Candidatus Omnitrophica bacterium]|nr:carbamoyltransferase HypF [Candidatus Omnitrophota bacterium]
MIRLNRQFKFKKGILAFGAELKSNFCIGTGSDIYISDDYGDLGIVEKAAAYQSSLDGAMKDVRFKPSAVACDLHPAYASGKLAEEFCQRHLKGKAPVRIQHHRAHVASAMIEGDIKGKVIGVAFDGTGYGTDGAIWGGEFFAGDIAHLDRIAHLDYIPMPGADMAVKEPWRMAASYLYHYFGKDFLDLDIKFVKDLDKKRWKVLRAMVERGVNSPVTSSAGRLFDAVSAILGICTHARYEAEAAIELQKAANRSYKGSYGYGIELDKSGDRYIVKWRPLLKGIIDDIKKTKTKEEISAKFHNTFAEMIVSVISILRKRSGYDKVVFSGGVFLNDLLVEKLKPLLKRKKLKPYFQSRELTGDSGICIGQAAITNSLLSR